MIKCNKGEVTIKGREDDIVPEFACLVQGLVTGGFIDCKFLFDLSDAFSEENDFMQTLAVGATIKSLSIRNNKKNDEGDDYEDDEDDFDGDIFDLVELIREVVRSNEK